MKALMYNTIIYTLLSTYPGGLFVSGTSTLPGRAGLGGEKDKF